MDYKKIEKNTIRRGAKKASYNRDTIHTLLDASVICNVAFNVDGQALVQPINFGRNDEFLYMHSSLQNRMTSALIESGEVCLTVSFLDSMKFARSAFHHSVNFRSAVVFGKVRELVTKEEKLLGLKSIINHFVPDRWDNCRSPNDKELKATRLIEIEIESASAKIAEGPSSDNKEDIELDFWAGQLPIKTICEHPIPSTDLPEGKKIPEHILEFYEKRKSGF